MNKRMYAKRSLAVRILAVLLFVSALWNGWDGDSAGDETAKLQWFSSVSYWDPPQWSQEEDTVTGQITKKTGVSFEYTIPKKNADVQLRQMLVKDELPDVITVTNFCYQKRCGRYGITLEDNYKDTIMED